VSGGEHNGAESGHFRVIVVAASLGGPAAISQLLGGLPADFPVPLLVVQHRIPAVGHEFAQALQPRTPLPVRTARDGEALTPGVSVLPARQTATVDSGGILRLRPCDGFRLADPLITSVAERYGPQGLCVVLTGRLDDAAAGIRALKRHGGRSIAQDPATAYAPQMPSAALATGCVDLVMPLADIPATLIALTMAPGAADLVRVPPSPWANLVA
jgi:two-component system chemotaxis response regulator CheB